MRLIGWWKSNMIAFLLIQALFKACSLLLVEEAGLVRGRRINKAQHQDFWSVGVAVLQPVSAVAHFVRAVCLWA